MCLFIIQGSVAEEIGPTKPAGNILIELFWKYAGDDRVVDAIDVRNLINILSNHGKYSTGVHVSAVSLSLYL